MKVCIAEKPSVAKEIAGVLGAKIKKDGYFEGNGYQVTWTFGHLCTLKEPHEYDGNWKWWNLNTLPILPIKFDIKVLDNSGVKKQFNTIASLVSNATEVINCGDAGQEGELIQRWVLKLAKNTKPLKRLWISSLTEEAIKDGFKNLREGSEFDQLFYAGNSRAIGDWLLGMNATRLYTLKYAQPKQLLSIGRVQTPTLALIVNRQLEISNFVPQTYWELKTKYREVIFSALKGKFHNKEEAESALGEVGSAPFIISGIETKKGKEAPPRLFDLTSLQVECNKRFGFSADDTLKTVQGLYEKKYVTYPRVDTTYLSNDLFPKIPGILKGLAAYENLTAPLLQKPIKKTTKVFNDNKVTDHHAIIPTGISPSGLSSYEEKVYDAITRRFIAAFYPDCEFSSTTVMGDANKIEFKATGKQILQEGWRVVFQKETTNSNEEEQEETQLLPSFTKGETGPHEPVLAEKQTQPPKPYTEATLLRAMETAGKQVEDEELREAMKDNGIGRPSTRAAIIETLFKRNYIKKEKKNLVATPTGIGLIGTIKNELLKSAELTGQWEYKLRQIEKGEYDYRAFLNEMKQMVSSLVVQVVSDKSAVLPVGTAPQGPLLCPKCKQPNLVKGKTAIGCKDYKECGFKIPFVVAGVELNAQQMMELIKNGSLAVAKGSQKGTIAFDNNFEAFFKEPATIVEKKKPAKTAKKPIGLDDLPCPKCKNTGMIKGKTAYGCANWKAGCGFRLPLHIFGKDLSLSMLEPLLLKGETKTIKSIVLADGATVNGKFCLDKDFAIVLKQ